MYKKIVSFRNMLTHNDLNSALIDYQKAKILLSLTYLLELTLIFNLLKQTGLPESDISKLLNQPHTIWFRLVTKTRNLILDNIDK